MRPSGRRRFFLGFALLGETAALLSSKRSPSIRFPPAATIPEIIPSQGAAHYGFVLALIAAVAI